MRTRARGSGGDTRAGGRLYAEIFSGLKEEPDEVVDAFFGEEHHEEIVMVRDIPFYSCCEHHLVPFHGQAHVAYLPKGRVTGSRSSPVWSTSTPAARRCRSGSPPRWRTR